MSVLLAHVGLEVFGMVVARGASQTRRHDKLRQLQRLENPKGAK